MSSTNDLARKRQRVDETVAVPLLHGRVHEDGSGKAVAVFKANKKTEKFLERNLELLTTRITAAVDHGVGFDPSSVIQLHGVRGHLGCFQPEQTAISERFSNDLMQAL